MDQEQILEFAKHINPDKRIQIMETLQKMDREMKRKREQEENTSFPEEYVAPEFIERLYNAINWRIFSEAKKHSDRLKKYLEYKRNEIDGYEEEEEPQ
jgi:hypothetical protein